MKFRTNKKKYKVILKLPHILKSWWIKKEELDNCIESYYMLIDR